MVVSSLIYYFNSIKDRKKAGSKKKAFFIEGPHLVEEALLSGVLEKVLYSPKAILSIDGKDLIRRIKHANIPAEETIEAILNSISDVSRHQGIVASAKIKEHEIVSVLGSDDPLILIACAIQDPGNLGTMIRTADAVKASGVVLTSGTVDLYNDKVIRATAGSIFHLNIVKIDDIIEMISSLKRRGVKVFSTSLDAKKSLYEADLKGPTALIIGNEGSGVPLEIEHLCDESIYIPMKGDAESLNAAVSSAVILYEAFRQRS
jgi:RNA methyltransferase, TrmH family